VRVLLVHPGPDFSVADVHDGYRDALETLGCQVRSFTLNDLLAFYTTLEIDGRRLETEDAVKLVNKHLLAKCYEWRPDVVFVVSGFFVSPFTWDIWKHRNHKTVVLFTESPYEEDKQLAAAAASEPDLVLVNDPTNLDRYREAGHTAFYLPHAYRPDVHRPRPEAHDPDYDFVFVGTGYPSRIDFLERVAWGGLKVALGGHWETLAEESPLRRFLVHPTDECFPNDDAVRLYQRADASLNLYRAARGFQHLEANGADLGAGYALGPREVELAATGTFFLRESRGEGDVLLPTLPVVSSPEDFGEQLRWWLAHDDERVAAAAAAREAVSDRSFTNQARRILALLAN
jgi:spore maturation protein CgeB